MEITAIIQARMKSTRLPSKVMMPIGKDPLIWYVYNRISLAHRIKKVFVATSLDPSDDVLFSYCEDKNIPVFRGSLDDVLDRYYTLAKREKSSHIARVTADCPLIDQAILNDMAGRYLKMGNKVDYYSNVHPPTFPDGMDLEIFSFEALETAWKNAALISEREHVTPYIYNNPSKFRIQNYENSKNDSWLRLTVDEKEDYEVVKMIYEHFDFRLDFGLKDIITFFMDNKELTEINSRFLRNEGYLKSVREDKAKNSLN